MEFKDKDYKEIGFVISIGLAIVVIIFTMIMMIFTNSNEIV